MNLDSLTAGAVCNSGMSLRVIGLDDEQIKGEDLLALYPAYQIVAPDTTHACFDDCVLFA